MVEAGRRGEDIRSDCWVALELKETGGLDIDIQSKVASMYGDAIEKQCRQILSFYSIENAELKMIDLGALPFVISARVETAIRRATPDIRKPYLPEMRPECLAESSRNRFRRSRLYLPGNEPKFMINAGIHKPDAVILDLEDSVAPGEKDAARILVRNALRRVDFYGAERMVRINQMPEGLEDLKYLIGQNVNLILIPKCETREQVKEIDNAIGEFSQERQKREQIFLMPIIETAFGVENAFEIAKASPNIVALTMGLEDYTADLGTVKTKKGSETLWARCRIVNAARAAKLQPIDSVYSDVADEEGLMASVKEARSLGYEGKGCIHPRQIRMIHQGFMPSAPEVEKAKRIMSAWEAAQEKGSGVCVVGTKMIDPPVVKRAERILQLVEMDRGKNE